ncbi:MAG: family 1 glycosylhydrolase [Candidatus Kapaibacterium sp.]
MLPPLELWGGMECTVNRIGENYLDQLGRNGHMRRPGDLDLLAGLGMRTFRYPVLWEHVAPESLDTPQWSWSDERLGRLRELGIRPVVGLVHHGSGPRYTSLIDPEFPEKLARYAGMVAERYPWVERYTPINEPLTTARFSTLYGHWYPHQSSPLAFARAMLLQCRGTILAMRAIRKINPDALLVQTEDLGKTHSTPTLAYQAEFENQRRWLTNDLLCGLVTAGHPMTEYFRWLGVDIGELEWFTDNALPPDLIGVNHYLTSERFLDERLGRYPESSHGSNGQHWYADVEAVRVCAEGIAGPYELIRETWERYHRPIAITEAHLGCDCDEQMRWLKEMIDAAHSLRFDGVDLQAVTAWSLMGAYDWDSLLTRSDGHYEAGAFDARFDPPQPTALATMLRDLATHGTHYHKALESPGWWRRPDRLLYPPVSRSREAGIPQRERLPGYLPLDMDIASPRGDAGETQWKAFVR